MTRIPKPRPDPDDAPLKRLGGGRWQTRDARFTIEPQSGTWVIVDGEQTDDLGMALVRGPFPSLTTAKAAIAIARSSAPPASPLAERIERRRREPPAAEESKPVHPGSTKHLRAKAAAIVDERAAGRSAGPRAVTETGPARPTAPDRARPAADDEPREAGWLAELGATERGRARRLIAGLRDDGVTDPEGLVRRDVAGDVPALAAMAIARRLAGLGADASPDEVSALLAEGRDDRLGVRWRLVDDKGRPIVLDRSSRRR